jgi:hypothetical protein
MPTALSRILVPPDPASPRGVQGPRRLLFEEKRPKCMDPERVTAVTEEAALAAHAYWHVSTGSQWICHDMWDQEDRQSRTVKLRRTGYLLGVAERVDGSYGIRIRFECLRPGYDSNGDPFPFQIECTTVMSVMRTGPSEWRCDVTSVKPVSYNDQQLPDDIPQSYIWTKSGTVRTADYLYQRYAERPSVITFARYDEGV